jgi:hypothetical protein
VLHRARVNCRPIESCPPTPSAATSNKAILFNDEIGFIINELSIETHDRPARSDLLVSADSEGSRPGVLI